MKLPKELTTVTTFSKYVALSLFIFLPIFAFILGMRYQTMLTNQSQPIFRNTTPILEPITCTQEMRTCPDGSFVGRSGRNCEFGKCIDPQRKVFCGGIAGKLCPSGYYCKYDGTFPDAGGTCMR